MRSSIVFRMYRFRYIQVAEMSSIIRTAKIFQNGGSRAIRLPKEFDVSGDEVLIKQDLGVITIMPKRQPRGSFLALLEAIGPVELAPRDQPGASDIRSDRALRTPKRPRKPLARRR